MRIDAHHHVWDLTVRDQPWTAGLPILRRTFTIEDLRPALIRHSIDATIVVQTVCVAAETPELLALASREEVVAGVVGWVELGAGGVEEALAELLASPGGDYLVGLRHQVQEEPDPWYLARPEVRRGLRAIASAGLAYDVVVIPEQLPAVLDTVRAVPELRFVLDHAGKPSVAQPPAPEWLESMTGLAELENLTVKLSGLTSAAPPDWTSRALEPFVDALLARFGPERLMFGSDWPVCLLGRGYDATISAMEELTAQLSQRETDLLFGSVAAGVYGLSR